MFTVKIIIILYCIKLHYTVVPSLYSVSARFTDSDEINVFIAERRNREDSR